MTIQEQAVMVRGLGRNWTDLLSRESVAADPEARRALAGRVYIAKQQFEAALDALCDMADASEANTMEEAE